MNIRQWLLAAVIAAGCALSAGAAGTVDEIIAAMSAAEKNITTLQFNYEQEIVYIPTNERQRMTGTVSWAQPDRLFIRQTAPVRQDIISNGKKIWIYTPQYRQALVDTVKRRGEITMASSLMLNIGRASAEMQKKYTVTLAGEESGADILSLAPREKDLLPAQVWVDRRTSMPVKAVFDGDGMEIRLAIGGYRFNPRLDKNMFTFIPPDGVEVISMP